MGYRIFTRKELYNLLTEKPIGKIADEYGLAYSDLRNVCIEYVIPFRSALDWQRISAGQEVERKPLTGDPESKVSIRLENHSGKMKRTYTKWGRGPGYQESEKRDSVVNREKIPVVDGYSVQNVNWDMSWIQKGQEVISGSPNRNSTEVISKTDSEDSSDEWIEIPSELISERIARFPVTATFYQILGITPDPVEYKKVDVCKVIRTARGINALKRNRTHNLHDLLLRPLNHNTNFSTHTAECTLGFCGQTVSSLFQDASGACA